MVSPKHLADAVATYFNAKAGADDARVQNVAPLAVQLAKQEIDSAAYDNAKKPHDDSTHFLSVVMFRTQAADPFTVA